VSKIVEKIRKNKRFDDEYSYEKELYRERKKSKLQRSELKRLKTQEYEDYAFDAVRRYR